MLQNLKIKNVDTATSNIIAFPKERQTPRVLPHVADPLAPTIFHEAWWLNIVTGGDYAVAEVTENDEVVGRLPHFVKSRLGMKYSFLPPMTHFLGPAVIEGEGSAETRFLRRNNITRELISQLPAASVYKYKCHRDITDTIAFQQENFMTNVQFTHEIMPDTEEAMWKNMRSQKRKKIRGAEKLLTLGSITDPMEFWHFYNNNIHQKKKNNICDRILCGKLIEGALSRDRGHIYAARDKNNDLVAAVFCIWDDTSSFYFMSTRTQEAHNGAVSMLAWEGMKDAAKRGLIFDFDGLSTASGMLFFTEFGGIVRPRYVVTRTTLPGRIALSLKDMSRESRYFF